MSFAPVIADLVSKMRERHHLEMCDLISRTGYIDARSMWRIVRDNRLDFDTLDDFKWFVHKLYFEMIAEQIGAFHDTLVAISGVPFIVMNVDFYMDENGGGGCFSKDLVVVNIKVGVREYVVYRYRENAKDDDNDFHGVFKRIKDDF